MKPASKSKHGKPAWINATVITASLFWVWTALFHDAGSLYVFEMSDSFFNGKLFGAYLNCASQPLGFAIGSLVCFFTNKKGISLIRRKTVLFACCITLFCLFYLSLEIAHLYALSSSIALCATAVGAILWMEFFVELMQQGPRSLAAAVLASMTMRRLCSAILPAIFSTESLAAIIFLHGAFLALSYPGIFASGKGGETLAGASEKRTVKANDNDTNKESAFAIAENSHAASNLSKIPWQLFLHLSCYGIGFGTIHGTLGVNSYLYPAQTIDAASRLAMSTTGLVFALAITIACIRKLHKTESLWQRVRGIVFPLVIISYSLIPILGNIALPSTLAEDGNITYNTLFTLGCLMMMKETDVKPPIIVGVGCFFKCMGFLVGVLLGYALASSGAIASSTTSQLVTLAIFIAFSLGTFWIGSERQMRHWWGLRCVRTPQYQHSRILEEKCSELAQRHELSPREAEFLVMLAQGKRAAKIKEDCGLSIFTVRNHIQNIYRKLDVHSIEELSQLVDDMQDN